MSDEIRIKKPVKKKAPNLASLFTEEMNNKSNYETNEIENTFEQSPSIKQRNTEIKEKKSVVKKIATTLYIPESVKDKLEEIQFSERKMGVNQNDLILEGIDLLFKKRGYPSIKKLTQ